MKSWPPDFVSSCWSCAVRMSPSVAWGCTMCMPEVFALTRAIIMEMDTSGCPVALYPRQHMLSSTPQTQIGMKSYTIMELHQVTAWSLEFMTKMWSLTTCWESVLQIYAGELVRIPAVSQKVDISISPTPSAKKVIVLFLMSPSIKLEKGSFAFMYYWPFYSASNCQYNNEINFTAATICSCSFININHTDNPQTNEQQTMTIWMIIFHSSTKYKFY